MKNIYVYLSFLGLTGSVGGASHYFATVYSNKNLEEWIEDLNKWVNDLEEKIKNSVKKIQKQVKNYPDKENLKKLWSKFLGLQGIKNYINKVKNFSDDQRLKDQKNKYEAEIRELKQKIKIKNLNNFNIEEVYEKMEKNALLEFEIYRVTDELINAKKEIIKEIDKNFNSFNKFVSLNKKIEGIQKEVLEMSAEENLKKIEELEKQVFENKKEIEQELSSKELKNLEKKIRIWLDLDLKEEKLLDLSGIFYSAFDD